MALAGKDGELFDQWPQRYDDWFVTPIGTYVKKVETELLLAMLEPHESEHILDVGCGTGVFTGDVLYSGARVTGLDLSLPMLQYAAKKNSTRLFQCLAGNMTSLPFGDEIFDKAFSMTAIEFVEDAQKAVDELNRVTKRNGTIVLTTLNSLSPWAKRRTEEGRAGHSLFKHMYFRSPSELNELVSSPVTIKTAIHFLKEDDPGEAEKIEQKGSEERKDTGAFLAMTWKKA